MMQIARQAAWRQGFTLMTDYALRESQKNG
jgi:hypothetical protein